jgi:ribosomal protein S18 acetylase RimI-like enzyme
MAGVAIRQYEAKDFAALHKLDQACFPPGIAYSKFSLQYFLSLPAADCLVAEACRAEVRRYKSNGVVGFILAETNPPLAHIITLDVAESHRRAGVGTSLVAEMDKHFRFKDVRSVLLETAVDNETAIAFWKKHGYREEAVLKRYYSGKMDAYEMRKRLD